MTLIVAPIVEGETEQLCVERLLQRVWRQLLGQTDRLQVLEPFRGRRDQLVQEDGVALRNMAEKAYAKLMAKVRTTPDARSLLLVLLDAERDCPKTLAERLRRTVEGVLPTNATISCVLAKQMIENWILAGCSDLAGVNGLPDDLPLPDQVEAGSGVEWIKTQLKRVKSNRAYKKSTDTSIYVLKMNIEECQTQSRSFRKLRDDLAKLRISLADPGTENQGSDI